jgi:hypothetical protein
MKTVAVADEALGGRVGVGANNIAYEHPERKIHKREINRYFFIILLLTQPGYEYINCSIKGNFRVSNKSPVA